MTSEQMSAKSTPAACERIGGTTAYWLSSPSPGSPMSRKEAGPSPAEVETRDEAQEVDRVALAREFGDLLQGSPWGDES